jgi:hypothetical protein
MSSQQPYLKKVKIKTKDGKKKQKISFYVEVPPEQITQSPRNKEKKTYWKKRLLASALIGLITTFVIGIILWALGMPITLIISVSAPIWSGVSALCYHALGERFS